MRTQEETRKLIASLPRGERVAKANQILDDGKASIGVKVDYLVTYCGMDFMEVYEAMTLGEANAPADECPTGFGGKHTQQYEDNYCVNCGTHMELIE